MQTQIEFVVLEMQLISVINRYIFI